MNKCVLQTAGLTIGYKLRRGDSHLISRNVDLFLNSGEVVCLIGPNGSGKSTLIRTITGLLPPIEGEIILEGSRIETLSPKELAKRVGIVTTERVNIGMFAGRTLVSLGRFPYTDWTGRLTAEDEAIVSGALRSVGAEGLAERNVGELSDGERQKIMIARALAQDPHIIVLDEPTAFLDLPRRVEIMALLKKLTRDTEKAILLSTHDLDLALQVADVLWLISQHGTVRVGSPEDLVLSGALEEDFSSQGVEFDRRHGAFIMHRTWRGTIGLQADGIEGIWTRKALERAGYHVHAGKTAETKDLCVRYSKEEGMWYLVEGEKVVRFSSLYGLAKELRVRNRLD